jgi:hypothetical protein
LGRRLLLHVHPPVLSIHAQRGRNRGRLAEPSTKRLLITRAPMKRKLTVPVRRSARIDDLEGKCDGVIKRQRTASCILRIESLFAERVDRSDGGLLV